MTVVGVVANAHHDGPNRPVKPELFLPVGQVPARSFSVTLDPARGQAAALDAFRDALRAVDPLIPMGPVTALDHLVSETVALPKLYAGLVASLAAAALALAALGVFGVMAYVVTLRRREIGVRLALGARPGAIRALVLGQGGRLALIGGALGLVGAALLTRLLRGLLFGVSALDPVTFAGVALMLAGVALVAAWLPATRAMRVDPLVAMREE